MLILFLAQYHNYREAFIWRNPLEEVNRTEFNYVNSTGNPAWPWMRVQTVCCDGDISLRLLADPSVFRFDTPANQAGFVCSRDRP